MRLHGARQRHALGRGARRERGQRHPHRRCGVVRLRGPAHQPVHGVAGAARVPQFEREPRHLQRLSRPHERLERRARVAGGEQGLRARDRRLTRRCRRQIGEELEREARVARDPRFPDAEPGVDGRQSCGARHGIVGGSAVALGRSLPRERGAHGEQRRAGPTSRARTRPRGHVVRRRLGREAEARLSLGQHGERFPLRVILEPGLSCEEAPRQIIAPGLELRLRALDDEGGVEVRLARGRGEQRLGGVPEPAGEPQRLGALGGGLRGRRGHSGWGQDGHLLRRRQRERRQRGADQERDGPHHGTCRTRIRARSYSPRDSGVSLNRPKPVWSWKKRVSRSWL